MKMPKAPSKAPSRAQVHAGPVPSFTSTVLGPRLQRSCKGSCGGTCESCRKKKPELQRSSLARAGRGIAANGQGLAPPIVHQVLRSSGQPLGTSTRTAMERRLGHDLSKIRIHASKRAAASAEAVQAAAYTVGRHVVFGAGRFAPGTAAGRQLLAHELVHTVQQGAAADIPSRLAISPATDAAERQAEGAARNGGTVSAGSTSPVAIQRVISPASYSDEAKTAREAIAEGKKALANSKLSKEEREALQARVTEAEVALSAYISSRNQATLNPFGLPPVVAGVRTEGFGFGPTALLGAAISIGALLFANPEAVKQRGRDLEELRRRLKELERVTPKPIPVPKPQEAPKPVEVPKDLTHKPRVTDLPRTGPKPGPAPKQDKEPTDKTTDPAPGPRQPKGPYPICWAEQLGPPHRSDFVRVKGAPRDLENAKQGRMRAQWREFRDPDFKAKDYHLHHVDPLFLGGADDLKKNGIYLPAELHRIGHYVLARQPQMLTPPPGLPPLPVNLYQHPAGTRYRLVSYKKRAEEKGC